MSSSAVHPATLLWWQQRDKCNACVHRKDKGQSVTGRGGLGDRCTATLVRDMAPLWMATYDKANIGPPDELVYCIDARLEGAPCGPAARLFKEKT